MSKEISVYRDTALAIKEKLQMNRNPISFNVWYMNPNGAVWYENTKGFIHIIKASKGYTPNTFDAEDHMLSRDGQLKFVKDVATGLTKSEFTELLRSKLSMTDEITVASFNKITGGWGGLNGHTI